MANVFVAVSALVAGFLQGTTGFGAVMIMMMVLPFFYSMGESVGISTSTTIAGNLLMSIQYRKSIHLRKILLPALINIVINIIAVLWSKSIEQTLMKKAFGVFLIILSLYYLFWNKGNRWELSPSISFLMILISAVCNSLFGIGGPLMAIYFMNTTESRDEYLGTIQCYFFITGIGSLILRLSMGILDTSHIFPIIIGMIGVLVAGQFSKKIISRLDIKLTQTLTYALVGITGIYNLFK